MRTSLFRSGAATRAILARPVLCAVILPLSTYSKWRTGSGGTIDYNGGDGGVGTLTSTATLDVNGAINIDLTLQMIELNQQNDKLPAKVIRLEEQAQDKR